MSIPSPFDTFRLEKRAGEYKDFGVKVDSPYPLKGVTYPVDYGDIEGYVGEDGCNLDIFKGNHGHIYGFIKVFRPELTDGEHKFYIWLTDDEESRLLKEFQPVILANGRYGTYEELLKALEPFKQQNLS